MTLDRENVIKRILQFVLFALLLVAASATVSFADDIDNQVAAARDAFSKSDYSKALSLWQALLPELERRNDPRTPDLIFVIGVAYEKLGEAKVAVSWYRRAEVAHHRSGDFRGEASDLTSIGNIQFGSEEYTQALATHRAALEIDRKINNQSGEADDLTNIGNTLARMRRVDEAFEADRDALTLHRALLDHRGEAVDLRNIGNLEESLGRYSASLADQMAALTINRAGEDDAEVAVNLTDIGIVDYDLGRYDAALAAQNESLEIHRRLSDVGGQAANAGNIGVVELALGQYDRALISQQGALALYRQVHSRQGEANALHDLGLVEDDLGRFDDALRAQGDALTIYRGLGDRRGEADALGDLGSVQEDLRHYKDALASEAQALSIHRALGDLRGQANDLSNSGNIDEDLGRYTEALAAQRQALLLQRKLQNRLGEANVLINLAVVDIDLARFAEARTLATEAVALSRQLGIPDGLWRSLTVLANAESRFGDGASRGAAIKDNTEALDVLESLRADLGQNERGRFFADKLIAYDQLIVFLAQMERLQPGNGYGLSAFSVLERKEARAVLEQVASRSATRFRGVSPELLSEDQATKALVESAEATVERLSAGNAEPAEVAKARKDLADAVTGRELFETRLKTESPDYYALLHPKPVALDELRAVIGPNAAMLAYDVHDNLSVLFVVTRDLFKMLILPGAEALGHRTAVARSHIDKMLNAQRIAADSQMPIDLASQASRDLPDFQSDSYALYRELIPASVAAVLGRKSLIITPSGPLYDFPWEALVTKHEGAVTRYLLQDHAVSYVPSGSLLELVRTGERHAPNREPLLAFARPAFGSPAREGGPSNSKAVDEQSEYDALVKATGWSFPDLPGTKAEADAVAAILHADLHESVLTGDAASREKLLSLNATQQLMRYRYILFATHAVLQGTSVLRPALVLAHPATDGLVTIDDILGLSLDADLVDLSACNTGAGTRPSGDGINGLTRAFLYAGAPVISVALWDVDDRAAEAMAPKFFAAMSAGDGPAEALHRAKLTMLASNDARLRHPYAWAPSVVFGDGEPQRR